MSYSGITQAEFIAILFADCGYDTSAQRRGWLQKRFGGAGHSGAPWPCYWGR